MTRDRREYHRKWREAHPDYHRAYYLENPDKFMPILSPEQKERKAQKKSEREAKQRAALRAVRNHGVEI